MSKIDKLTIRGYKSIRSLEELPLGNLNVLIGANGVGKSNFVSYFRMLHELVEGRLQVWMSKQGGANRVFSYGVKETEHLSTVVRFGPNGYAAELISTVDDNVTFTLEKLFIDDPLPGTILHLGTGHRESRLREEIQHGRPANIAAFCYRAISGWKVYHFHDTTETALVKRPGALHDNASLRSDAANLAAFLYKLKNENAECYLQIMKTVRLAVPFFDDFVLMPSVMSSGEEQIRLLWKQVDSDYPLWAGQLSDGSLRFICLVTALLQPSPPSTIIIDEPELGLHPFAITLLGALLRTASYRMQVIISTQSVPLLNQFSIEDLIVVEREKGASTFNRLDVNAFKNWLKDYSVGELWEKNILGGRPSK